MVSPHTLTIMEVENLMQKMKDPTFVTHFNTGPVFYSTKLVNLLKICRPLSRHLHSLSAIDFDNVMHKLTPLFFQGEEELFIHDCFDYFEELLDAWGKGHTIESNILTATNLVVKVVYQLDQEVYELFLSTKIMEKVSSLYASAFKEQCSIDFEPPTA